MSDKVIESFNHRILGKNLEVIISCFPLVPSLRMKTTVNSRFICPGANRNLWNLHPWRWTKQKRHFDCLYITGITTAVLHLPVEGCCTHDCGGLIRDTGTYGVFSRCFHCPRCNGFMSSISSLWFCAPALSSANTLFSLNCYVRS